MTIMRNDQRGIALLTIIVIVVVAVTAVIGVTLIIRQYGKSKRDEDRMASIDQLHDALDAYYDEHLAYPCGTEFPPLNIGWYSDSRSPQFLNGADDKGDECPDGSWAETTNKGILSEDFIDDVPRDPYDDEGHQWWYFTNFGRQKYILIANLEGEEEMEERDGGVCDDVYESGHTGWWVSDPFRSVIVSGDSPCCIFTNTC